jgi:two-component system sensor histidine kinase/response regulator
VGAAVTPREEILVAEDDPASAEIVTYFLRSEGYRVTTAPDGNRALDLGLSGHFALVILDVHMPMYDGVEVLQMLRKRYIRRPIKVIALTADASPEIQDALGSGGIDSFLTKPIELETLRAEVRRLLVT